MNNRVSQVLIRNSFNILGLSTSATLKDIRQRAQQLLQIAKIEEIQRFETDIGYVSEFRSESEVKLALERVSGIKERLGEIFFWFDDHSIENQKTISLISKENYQEAIDILEKTSKANIDWLRQKNLALAYLFEAFSSSNLNNFFHALEIWKRLTKSEDFWKFYEKHYLFYDELGTSPLLFQEFRGLICKFLSCITVSFYHQTKKAEVVGAYYSAFGEIEKSIDMEILQPIIVKIKKGLEDLEKIVAETSDDDDLLKQSLIEIHKNFLELNKFELSEYSPLIILKDDSAEKIRSLSVDIYNQDISIELVLFFLDMSFKLAVSDLLKIKIESEEKIIKEKKVWKRISAPFDRIKELIIEQKIETAKLEYFDLDSELEKQGDASSNATRRDLLISFCYELIEKGNLLFDLRVFGFNMRTIAVILNRQKHNDAIQIFDDTFAILKDRVYLLNFINFNSIQLELFEAIDSMSNSLKNFSDVSLEVHRQAFSKKIDDIRNKQLDENTQRVIYLLEFACNGFFYHDLRIRIYQRIWAWFGFSAIIIIMCLGLRK